MDSTSQDSESDEWYNQLNSVEVLLHLRESDNIKFSYI